MYPKSIKIHQNNIKKEFVYYPGHHEDTFDVLDIEYPEKIYIFDIDIHSRSFKTNRNGIEEFENLIGKTIIENEFLNFRQ